MESHWKHLNRPVTSSVCMECANGYPGWSSGGKVGGVGDWVEGGQLGAFRTNSGET